MKLALYKYAIIFIVCENLFFLPRFAENILNLFSWIKILIFWISCQWNLFAIGPIHKKSYHWFRLWLGVGPATSHCLNQLWLIFTNAYMHHWTSMSQGPTLQPKCTENAINNHRNIQNPHFEVFRRLNLFSNGLVPLIQQLNRYHLWGCLHGYSAATMSTMASQILIVYSKACLGGAYQRKHQSSASLDFMRGIRRLPVDFPSQRASNTEIVSIWWRHHGLTTSASPHESLRHMVLAELDDLLHKFSDISCKDHE